VDERAVYNLNDNPSKRCTWSGASGQLPTLTRWIKFWVPSRGRVILPREAAAAMGWPVFDELASAAGVSASSVEWQTPAAGGRLGNSMHVANVAMVLAVALSCIEDRA
jgi:hypothetical protein